VIPVVVGVIAAVVLLVIIVVAVIIILYCVRKKRSSKYEVNRSAEVEMGVKIPSKPVLGGEYML